MILFESEGVNMSIRGKTVLIALAITLIGTAPAWSQSLLKKFDTDNDGTVVSPKRRVQPPSCSTSSTAITMAPSTDANCEAGSTRRISLPQTPTTTEL